MKTLTVGVMAAMCLGLAVAGAAADEPQAAARNAGHLVDMAGNKFSGELVPVAEAEGRGRDTILWRSPKFTEPFELRLADIAGVFLPGADGPPTEVGSFVQLRGGDVLPATVESLDGDVLVVSTPGPDGPQRLRIARGEVVAISRNVAGVGSYVGPTGLEGWEQVPAGAWHEEARRLVSGNHGAMLTRDVGGPARARYRIRLSRRGATEFRIAVAAAERPGDDGYSLHAVGPDGAGVMLVRRSEGAAAIEPVPAVTWRDDMLEVVLFVDQEKGRLAVIVPGAEGDAGRRATEVTLRPADNARPSGRFRLELGAGEIGLDRLEVGAWRGAEPTLDDATGTTVVTGEGLLEGFVVSSYDEAGAAYVLSRGDETKRVAAADIEEIRFSDDVDEDAPAAIRVQRKDGASLSGELVKIDDRAVWLRRRGVDAVVAMPRDAVVAIRAAVSRRSAEEPAGRLGTLVIGQDRLQGRLAGAAGTLAWRPSGGVNAATFAGPVDAEIEYVARRPPLKSGEAEVGGIGGLVSRDLEGFFIVAMMTEGGAAARDGRIQPSDRIVAIAPSEKSRYVETKDLDNETVTQLLRGRVGTTVRLKMTDAAGGNPRDIDLARGPINVAGREILEQALQTHARLAGVVEGPDAKERYPAIVVLRSGDTAPCRIESIVDGVVMLQSPLAGDGVAVRVPTELVKAVKLIPQAAGRPIDKTMFERLMTLPRMQRDRPPTHLLRLVDGDYLRGRLVKLDAATVTFEVLDVAKELSREQVVNLIWLHPDVPRPEGEKPEPAIEAAPEGLVAQGVTADGNRLTLVADGVEGDSLRGRSRAFGPAAIDLARVDRVLLGAAVGRDTRELPFAKWKLTPAPEPRALGKPAGE